MNDFQPTLFFGFQLVEGEQKLHQMFVHQTGATEWRLVPMIELGKKDRAECIVGTLPEDGGGSQDD